jgi:hypothetical protein
MAAVRENAAGFDVRARAARPPAMLLRRIL